MHSLILGIESSCDDTAAAVIEVGPRGPTILSNEVWTDPGRHAAFGGVVPEIAARSHVEKIDEVVARALAVAGVGVGTIGLIAATAGPGLIGGVMVGLSFAKGLALASGAPLVPINHLEGHALTVRLDGKTAFPYLLLLVSGGHTQLVLVEGVGRYTRIGATIDDAAGEAFDKTAKLLGLPQPGGPHIEKAAATGDARRFRFPAPLARREDFDFSFSGLKTAVRLAAEEIASPSSQDTADIARGFQDAAAAHLASKTLAAMQGLSLRLGSNPTLVVAGGVAANGAVREALSKACDCARFAFTAPPLKLCTDNAAMIAWAGHERRVAGLAPHPADALGFVPRARWPLAAPLAGRAIGGGKRGPKA